jgi:hypothetical protein
MNSVTEQQQADSQHPWIGLASFTEGDREFFAGRGDEIEQLLRLVRRDTLALLYSISGLGKTSLLQAGLFPALRAEDSLPTIIRLDYLEGAAPLATQVVETITAAAAAAKVDAPQPRPGETLWEYFHREDNHFWSLHNDLITPFLAFDQFEEFFTLGRETADRGRRASEFMSELADLVENRPPAALRDDLARAKEFNFKPTPLKILLAMREDYLGDLDYLRSRFRALGQNRLRLLPMGERQAREVIALGASLLAPGTEDRIVKAVAGASPNGDSAEITVAPALLSLVLQELNERRLRRGSEAKITLDLLDIEQEKILEDFYSRTLKDFPVGVRTFVEDELLTASGHRNSCALDDALTKPGVTESVLNELVNRRLLAYEDRHSTRRVELTHDVLIPVIKVSRDTRRTNEALEEAERLRLKQAAQRRKQHLTAALAGALAIALLATLFGGYYGFFREHKEYYRYFAKRNGFPVGIMQISESQARKLPVSFQLIHKGINWKWTPWWKPQRKPPLRWKPVFRVKAVNGLLELTTNHSVFPYLWKGELESEDAQDTKPGEKGEQLGLRTVCQWEFVSTREGEIIYEQALDGVGRIVYGLVYSPRGSASPSTRSARYVGPNGFPRKLQRPSAAEYVQIRYDGAGWEDRIMYRDAKGLAAAGPDGAFGQSMLCNDRGQVTRVLSLDEFENPVKDDDGNSGTQMRFDEKGYDIEDTSVGPDLKPRPWKDDHVIRKYQYDIFGRLRRTTFYGARAEPVLSKKYGYHGWEADYDEHGNQTVVTYLGLDGKPMPIADGYATMKSAYDAHGKMIRMRVYGVNGEPVLSKKYGYHGWEADYDEHGNQTVMTRLGLDGKPIALADGYATMKSAYDTHAKMIRMRVYGVNGEPVLSKEYGYHGREAEYDEHGNQTVETYLGLDGKPTLVADGYATVKSAYDARGNTTRLRFYGVNGEPVLSKEDGYHGWDAEYDEHGNRTVMTYLGLDGKPTLVADGYATVKSAYDARGNTTRLRVYGVNGEPVLSKEYGHHGWDAEYDEQGKRTVETHLGLDGKPTLLADGYATLKMTYDARGNRTRMRFYGVNGEPVLSKEYGHHGWEADYDKQNHQTIITFIGPTSIADGYATVKSTYDEHGNEIQRTFHGVNGEPVLSKKDGCYGQEAEYDEQGNRTVVTYLGLDEKPTTIADGYVTMKSTYGAGDKEVRRTFLGVNGEPVQHKDGYYGREEKYDEQGNETVETYLGLDGKPTPIADGYVTMKSTYDAGGKEVRRTFLGVNGEPVQHKNGYYGREDKYDEQDHKIAETYLGLDGKPMPIADGYATVKSTYDARGKLVRQTFHGVSGEPVLSKKDGYHGWEAKYDEHGNQTVKIYLGKDGKPQPKNPQQLLLSHGQKK